MQLITQHGAPFRTMNDGPYILISLVCRHTIILWPSPDMSPSPIDRASFCQSSNIPSIPCGSFSIFPMVCAKF